MENNIEKKYEVTQIQEKVEIEEVEEVQKKSFKELFKDAKELAKDKVTVIGQTMKNGFENAKPVVTKIGKTTAYIAFAAPFHIVLVGVDGVLQESLELATGKSAETLYKEKEQKRFDKIVKNYVKDLEKAKDVVEFERIYKELCKFIESKGKKVEDIIRLQKNDEQ